MADKAAMSPRTPQPKLNSSIKSEYGSPRKTESVLQRTALSRGVTISAGKLRRARLTRGIRRNEFD